MSRYLIVGTLAGGSSGVHRFSVEPFTPVNTTGAGDTFAAGVLEALCAGADIHEALTHGTAWGAVREQEIV